MTTYFRFRYKIALHSPSVAIMPDYNSHLHNLAVAAIEATLYGFTNSGLPPSPAHRGLEDAPLIALALRFPIDDLRQIPWIVSYRGPGSEAGCCSRNSSKVPPVRLSCCPPPLPAARAVARPPPATAPMAAPLPPPAMAPKAEPNPAPVATLRAVRPPCPCPCSRYVSVMIGCAVSLITMSVNCKASSAPPAILPADFTETNWPWTVVPRGAASTPRTVKLVSSRPVKRAPGRRVAELRVSESRTRIRVPAGTEIALPCAGAPA
jgi:hypothetical protein